MNKITYILSMIIIATGLFIITNLIIENFIESDGFIKLIEIVYIIITGIIGLLLYEKVKS